MPRCNRRFLVVVLLRPCSTVYCSEADLAQRDGPANTGEFYLPLICKYMRSARPALIIRLPTVLNRRSTVARNRVTAAQARPLGRKPAVDLEVGIGAVFRNYLSFCAESPGAGQLIFERRTRSFSVAVQIFLNDINNIEFLTFRHTSLFSTNSPAFLYSVSLGYWLKWTFLSLKSDQIHLTHPKVQNTPTSHSAFHHSNPACLSNLKSVHRSAPWLSRERMADNRYCVEYAKTGRSGCKKCKANIEKEQPRIGKITPNPFSDDGGDMKVWYHTRCIFETLKVGQAFLYSLFVVNLHQFSQGGN